MLKALPFTIINGQLYKQRQNQILHRFLHHDKISIILWEMHKGVSGGHFLVDITSRKVLDAMTSNQLYTRMHNIINLVMFVIKPNFFYIP
jgi:hypothetical protein